MKVQRTIAYNPIEPQQMSLRSAANMPLTIDIQYLDITGRALTSDLAAQLHVTSRTNNITDVYPVPATDIANGKARVSIGKDTLTDLNGYRLRLLGTYKGDATLLALGTLRLTESAGMDATPDDVIDDVPITLAYNYDCGISVRLWQDAAKTAPFDLSTATITAAVYASRDDTAQLTAFTVTPTMLPGEVMLQLTHDVVNTLPPLCWWSLRSSNAGGVITLCQGTVTISGVRPS